jgi:hypothetical protein
VTSQMDRMESEETLSKCLCPNTTPNPEEQLHDPNRPVRNAWPALQTPDPGQDCSQEPLDSDEKGQNLRRDVDFRPSFQYHTVTTFSHRTSVY